MPEPDTYSKAEIDDMVHKIYKAQEMTLGNYYRKLNDVYYLFNNSIIWLTTCKHEMQHEIDMLQR